MSALSLLAIVGMIGIAGRDLDSMAAPATIGTARLGLYGFLSIVIAGVMCSIWADLTLVIPGSEATLALLRGIAFGVLAYSCLMKARRTGEILAVSPFRYTRLLSGVALGVVFF